MTLRSKTKTLQKKFIKNNLSLALAESCTGGLLSAHITENPGTSKFFLGGVVCYANSAKRGLLGVPGKVIQKKGAVSKETALHMAKGARHFFRSSWAVAITGIAGPEGGTKIKPVGLVFFAVVGPKIVKVEKRNFKGSRKKIQRAAAEHALALLLKLSNA